MTLHCWRNGKQCPLTPEQEARERAEWAESGARQAEEDRLRDNRQKVEAAILADKAREMGLDI